MYIHTCLCRYINQNIDYDIKTESQRTSQPTNQPVSLCKWQLTAITDDASSGVLRVVEMLHSVIKFNFATKRSI